MYVLVDYDNLLPYQQDRGLAQLAEWASGFIADHVDRAERRVRIRLYGGWFEDQMLSKRAQTLSLEMQQAFPRIIRIPGDEEGAYWTASGELALGLLAEEGQGVQLPWTYRTRSTVRGLKVRPEIMEACQHADCRLRIIADFLETGRCPRSACDVRMSDFLYRSEQKLVDTMLSVDMLHATESGSPHVCVVSSDDDLWPAVRAVVAKRGLVLHAHTKDPGRSVGRYGTGLGGFYLQKVLWPNGGK